NGLASMSCTSSSFCMGVGLSGGTNSAFVEYNGSWQTPATDGSGAFVDGVSCVSTSFCVAVDQAGDPIIYDGAAWTDSGSSLDSTHGLTAVYCLSTISCYATGTGHVWHYDGSTWTVSASVGNVGTPIEQISCVSTSFCGAIDYSGNAFTYNG